jgi:carbonic anhydrase
MSAPKQLIAGFRRFRERSFTDDNAQFHALVQFGQTPSTMVVGCCDSRVDPALILDCAPPAESQGHYHGTSAALEFGVRNLAVQHIIVLGHAQCGGIQALLKGGLAQDDTFIAAWMRIAEDARIQVEKELTGASNEVRHRECEQLTILVSLNNLMTFSWIRERVEKGLLTLHGWYFDIERGELLGYNVTTQKFEPL